MNTIMNRIQDINLDDLDLKQQYYSLFLSGDIDGAKQLVSKNIGLTKKVLNATNLNNLINGLLEVENLFYTNVTDVLSDQLSKYQVSIDDLIYLSTYSPTTQYKLNNFVLYNDDIYYCFATPPIGTLPTNTTYWIYLGLKGIKGSPSLGVKYIGKWDKLVTYNEYDMVVSNNKMYVSKQQNINKNPLTDTTNWFLAMTSKPQGFFISPTEPTDIKVGQIWVKLGV